MEQLATSINDAAETLGIGRTTVYTLIKDGKLEVIKLGRRTLVKTSSIRALLNNT